jgi:ankyrin repeat protein
MGDLRKFRNSNSKTICSVFIPSNCKWNQLLGLVTLRLNSTKPTQYFEVLNKESESTLYVSDIETFKSCCHEASNPSDLVFIAHDEELPIRSHEFPAKVMSIASLQKELPVLDEDMSKVSSDSLSNIQFQIEERKLMIQLEEKCSWEEILLGIENGFHLKNIEIQSMVLYDEDGDQISSAIDNSSKFWKFHAMHLEEEGNYFHVSVSPMEPDTLKKSQSEVHDTSAREKKTSPSSSLNKTPSAGMRGGVSKKDPQSPPILGSPWLSPSKKTETKKQLLPKKQHNQQFDLALFLQSCSDGDMMAAKQFYQQHGSSSDVFSLGDKEGNTALHHACLKRHEFMIQWLVKSGADILASNNEGNTALHVLCANDGLESLKFCKKYCSNFSVHVKNKQNDTTLLHVATLAEDETMVRWLLDHSPEPQLLLNVVNEKGFTALHLVCWKNLLNIGKLLVERGACLNAKSVSGITPIYLACVFANRELVKFLHDSGAATKETTNRGDTNLHHAVCKADNEEIVEYLLEIGLNPEQPNYSGLTPLELVTQDSNEKLIHLMTSSSVSSSSAAAAAKRLQRSNPKVLQFFKACEMGNETAVDTLIQNEDISIHEVRDKYGRSGLHVACIYGHLDLLTSLIEDYAVDVNLLDIDGANILHLASLYGHLEIVQFLIEETSINLYHTTLTGDSPLHYACQAGHLQIIEYFLDSSPAAATTSATAGGATSGGTLVNLSNHDDENLLHICSRYGHTELANYLISKNILLTQKNKLLQTSLHLACSVTIHSHISYLPSISSSSSNSTSAATAAASFGTSVSLVELLLQYLNSNEINEPDYYGMTPLLLTCQQGNYELAQLLVQHGALTSSHSYHVLHCNSALHFSCQTDCVQLIEWLVLEQQCDVNYKNSKQLTCYSLAKLKDRLGVVKWFEDHQHLLPFQDHDSDSEDSDEAEEEERDDGKSPPVSPAKVKATGAGVAGTGGGVAGGGVASGSLPSSAAHPPTAIHMIHQAAICGNYIILKKCIQDGVDCNLCSSFGMTPLHYASRAGHLDLVKYLVSNGATLSATDTKGLTAIQYARDGNHEEIVRWLTEYEQKTKPSQKKSTSSSSSSSFFFSCLPVSALAPTPLSSIPPTQVPQKKPAAARLSTTGTGNGNGSSRTGNGSTGETNSSSNSNSNKSHTEDDKSQEILLCNYCTQGDLLEVKKLLQSGNAHINAVSSPGNRTPLHCACLSGNLQLVSYLLTNGANMNAQNLGGLTPLHIACDRNLSEICLKLIHHGADIEIPNKSGNNSLHLLCFRDCTQLFQDILLLPRTVVKSLDIDMKNSEGLTYMHIAVMRSNLPLVQFLSTYPSLVNARESKLHESPLHLSCQHGFYEITECLLGCHAFVNARNDHGQTALHYACSGLAEEISEEDSGQEEEEADGEEGSGGKVGGEERRSGGKGDLRLVKLLVKHGANLQIECDKGYNPLHYACEVGNLSLIKYLVKHGLSATENSEVSNINPIQVVKQQRHPEVYEWLLASILAAKVGKSVQEVLDEIHENSSRKSECDSVRSGGSAGSGGTSSRGGGAGRGGGSLTSSSKRRR